MTQLEELPYDQRALIQKMNEDAYNLGKMFQEGSYSDIVFDVQGTKIEAQKSILSIRSSVFRAMFQDCFEEGKNGLVKIVDTRPEAFRELLLLTYSSKSTKLPTLVEEILGLSEKYDINTVKSICEGELMKRLSDENAVKYSILADTYNANELKAKAMQHLTGMILNENDKKVLASHKHGEFQYIFHKFFKLICFFRK